MAIGARPRARLSVRHQHHGGHSGLPATAAATAKASLASALHVATTLPAKEAGQLSAAAKTAWMSGLSTSMIVGALIIATAAALALRIIERFEVPPPASRGHYRSGSPEKCRPS